MISLSRPSETLDYEILINDATFLSENALDVESSSEASLEPAFYSHCLGGSLCTLTTRLGT
jgi:hypothetical protein